MISQKVKLSLIGVLLGFIIGAILITLTGNGFLAIFTNFFEGTIGNLYNMGEWLMVSCLLILTGLSVAFAYKAGIFNIGAEGQFIVGSMTSAVAGIYLDLPIFFHAVVAILLGVLAGALYGMIPGLLKAFYGVSEVVVTIMLNWIALYYTNYLINYVFIGNTASKTLPIKESASINSNFLSQIFGGARMHYGFIIVIIALFLYWFTLEKTRFGYELKAVGYNKNAARYAGMKDKRATVLTLMISGAFAGAAGAIYSLGAVDALNAASSFRNYGFDGITIAFLGQMNAIGITFAALLIGGLRSAARIMIDVPKEIIDIVIGIILTFSVLAPYLLKKYMKRGK